MRRWGWLEFALVLLRMIWFTLLWKGSISLHAHRVLLLRIWRVYWNQAVEQAQHGGQFPDRFDVRHETPLSARDLKDEVTRNKSWLGTRYSVSVRIAVSQAGLLCHVRYCLSPRRDHTGMNKSR
jgi:hypothetical protein